MKRFLHIMVLVITLFALPAIADWSSAESDDFALDTTIPEPTIALVAAAGVLYLIGRREK